jgi:hypothetical protein
VPGGLVAAYSFGGPLLNPKATGYLNNCMPMWVVVFIADRENA